jgi:hypothetical protein
MAMGHLHMTDAAVGVAMVLLLPLIFVIATTMARHGMVLITRLRSGWGPPEMVTCGITGMATLRHRCASQRPGELKPTAVSVSAVPGQDE